MKLGSSIKTALSQATIGDYFELLKPRVMSLVVFSAFVGLWIAPGHIHPYLGFLTILSIAFGAGASGAINMWYDRDIDVVMSRTKKRPLPRGVIEPDDALFLGIFLTCISVSILGLSANWLSALLLGFASFFYIFIYTMWLKRSTSQNIVIGGAAGAFPPMIGWVAVTGEITIEPIVLFLIIFFWTPPHFWALSLYKSKDYKKAKIPMMPLTAGERSTKIQMLVYTLLLLPLVMVPYFIGMVGIIYLLGSIVLGLIFIVSAVCVLREESYFYARLMFGYSIFYLFALFALMMVDKTI